jgi:ribosomal protein S17
MKLTRAFVFQLLAWSIGGFIVGVTLSDAIHGLTPPRLTPSRAAIQPQTAGAGHQFASDAGIMLKFIKPDKTADFEATVKKVKEALTRSSKPERRQQALSWRVFKAVDRATNGDVVYVFEIDPAVRGADYTVSRILEEAFPTEAQALYRRYADSSSSRQHIVDLELIAKFGDEVSR